jgi:serine protease AprX
MRTPTCILKIGAILLWLSVSVSGQSSLASLSNDLIALILGGSTTPVRAIVRGDVATIQLVASRDGLAVNRVLEGMVVLTATPSQLAVLRQVAGIAGISRDARVSSTMTVAAKTMAADQARAASGGLLGIGGYAAVSGKGVGVAVIDSGIATSHAALAGKVVASVNFATGESSTADGYGHGTHIAGIIAGSPTAASTVTSEYQGGIAPGAHLINVKVLGSQGSGYTSDVIAGIQWTVANRVKYSIKVANLSLGHPQVEACAVDPLCLAVEHAAAAGLVVVASAGNSGKDADGNEVLASITTPGVAPSAITVGALVTWGTVTPDDDTIATYSSRGPTRFELGLKPDVVAPGNKIVSLQAKGAYLAARYPDLQVGGSQNNAYMKMSGTSMAAGMVSGGAALLLEGGALTAKQVKLALQLSATFMPEEGFARAGLGRVNLYSARRVNGAVMALTGVVPSATIAGRTVKPSGLMTVGGQPLVDATLAPAGTRVVGVLELLARWNDRTQVPSRLAAIKSGLLDSLHPSRFLLGDRLFLGEPILWGDRIPFGQQIVWGDHALGQQIVWGDQSLGQQIVWGDQSLGQQIVWGDQTLGQQIVWGDQTLGQQIVWGDQALGQQIVWGDQTLGQQIVWGDQTFGQQIVWGDHTTGQQIVWGDASSANANQIVWGDGVRPPQ